MTRPKIAPSLMCMNPMNVQRDIEVMDREFDLYHVDIMDAHFCPNMALTPAFTNELRRHSTLPIDVHLMVEDPVMFTEMLDLGPQDTYSYQAETIERNAFRLSSRVADKGSKFGVVLSPSTPLAAITGFAGQKFIPEMLLKIKQAVELRREYGLKYQIQLDGACNRSTFRVLNNAGADILIVGNSGLFSLAPTLPEAIDEFRSQFLAETGVDLTPRDRAPSSQASGPSGFLPVNASFTMRSNGSVWRRSHAQPSSQASAKRPVPAYSRSRRSRPNDSRAMSMIFSSISTTLTRTGGRWVTSHLGNEKPPPPMTAARESRGSSLTMRACSRWYSQASSLHSSSVA